MKRSKGFTLIELVVVITILGILAAVALPRFVNLQRDARIAKLNAARGAVQAAASMVMGAAQARTGQAQPNCPATGTAPTTVVAGGATAGNGEICSQNGLVTVIGWNAQAVLPGAGTRGIVDAAGLTSAWPATVAALNADGYAFAGGGAALNSVLTIQVVGGLDATTCSFTYTPSTLNARGTSPTISAMQVAGC